MDSLALTEAQHRRRSYAAAYYPSPMADAGVPSPPPPPCATADAACETIPISPGINSIAAVATADSAPPVPPCAHHEVAEIQGTPMHPSQPQLGVLTGLLQDGSQFVGGGTRGNQRYRRQFQVRGRGRKNRGGNGGGFHHPAPNASLPSSLVQAVELSAELAPVREVAPATTTTLTTRLKTPLWCDTCRVECYSEESLEMHKNGKRHKKTVVKLEKYEAQQKLESGVQDLTPQIETKIDAPVVILTEEATTVEVPPLTAPTLETNGRAHQIGKRKRPPAFGPTRVCTLCNAMCASEAIFEVHLGSKKHTARIKRLKGPGYVYGLVAAPIVIDQAAERSAEVVESLFFGLARCEMVEPQVNGVGEGISVQQPTVESGQLTDGAIEPHVNQDVEFSI